MEQYILAQNTTPKDSKNFYSTSDRSCNIEAVQLANLGKANSAQIIISAYVSDDV